MSKIVKVKLDGKVQRLDETALKALPRVKQIAVAVAMGVRVHRGASKNGIVSLILAK